ncbi:hypothetical protein V493_00529 [Pseudogymnoascus sp. VKM F-4281 (FW-2241)]|nr:hypothetical protein V493_00529 [Pseudogymnoascus sp. VKM F-4281 (FW-2241)]
MTRAPKRQIYIRELLDTLNRYDASEPIDKLLEKPEFLSLLSEAFNGLRPESKAAAAKCFLDPSSRKPPTGKRCAALAVIQEIGGIALPIEVSRLFDDCKNNPADFWTALTPRNVSIIRSTESISHIASSMYLRIQSLQISQKWDTVVWRYHVLFIYDLVLLIGNGQQRITKKLLRGLLQVLIGSGTICDDRETIETQLLHWCAAGRRYWKLCNALDDGALFLLPQQVSNDVWENEDLLPPGQPFDKAINTLSTKGIRKTSSAIGADILGTKLRHHILEPFRWNLPALRTASSGKSKTSCSRIKKNGSARPLKSACSTKPQPFSDQSRLNILSQAAIYSATSDKPIYSQVTPNFNPTDTFNNHSNTNIRPPPPPPVNTPQHHTVLSRAGMNWDRIPADPFVNNDPFMNTITFNNYSNDTVSATPPSGTDTFQNDTLNNSMDWDRIPSDPFVNNDPFMNNITFNNYSNDTVPTPPPQGTDTFQHSNINNSVECDRIPADPFVDNDPFTDLFDFSL